MKKSYKSQSNPTNPKKQYDFKLIEVLFFSENIEAHDLDRSPYGHQPKTETNDLIRTETIYAVDDASSSFSADYYD